MAVDPYYQLIFYDLTERIYEQITKMENGVLKIICLTIGKKSEELH